MAASFNLVDQGFIPVQWSDGQWGEVGLREALTRAHEIPEIRDDSPLVTVSLHRLLLAILHRVFGPRDMPEWEKLWKAGRFDSKRINAYLDQWHGRFDLFGGNPFYQCPDMEETDPIPVTRLGFVQANNATLFDHTTEDGQHPIHASQAARALVAYQGFAVGGGNSKPFNLCHSPVMSLGAYLAVAVGTNLFQTLWLNALVYSDSSPIPRTPGDMPLWERRSHRAPRKDGTPIDGYLDYLTWPSRRISLIAAEGDGAVREMRMLQGLRLPDGIRDIEPMAAYVKGKDGQYHAKGFQEGRTLWRDSHVLFREIADQQRPPLPLHQIAVLRDRDILPSDMEVRLAVFGVCSDRAKMLFWRHESMPLPLPYLTDDLLISYLQKALDACEKAAEALDSAVWRLAEIASTTDQGGRPDKDRVRQLAESLGADRVYWSQLEGPFRHFLVELPKASDNRKVLSTWARRVCSAARSVFEQIARSVASDGRTLKAIHAAGGASDRLNRGLAAIQRDYSTGKGEPDGQ